MSLAIVVLIGLLAIGVSDRNPVHPVAASVMLVTPAEEIDCQPAERSASQDDEKPNRTLHFRLSGEFDCRRPIFTADERDPIFERALRASVSDSKRVAEIIRTKLTDPKRVLRLRINGDYPPEFLEAVAAIYRNELLSSLGAGRLVRGVSPEAAELVVELDRADLPELIAHPRLRLPSHSKGGEDQWLNL